MISTSYQHEKIKSDKLLGDPRVVPSFRCPFFPNMPPSMTPGSFVIVMVQSPMPNMAFARI